MGKIKASELFIQHHSAVELIDRLEKTGAIERYPGAQDRREVWARLTVTLDVQHGGDQPKIPKVVVQRSTEIDLLLSEVRMPGVSGAGVGSTASQGKAGPSGRLHDRIRSPGPRSRKCLAMALGAVCRPEEWIDPVDQ